MKDQIVLIQGCSELVVRVEAQQESGQAVCRLLLVPPVLTRCVWLVIQLPLRYQVTDDLLLGFLERFLSLIGLHNDESCAAFNLFM
jgi:hypothetical protein